VSLTCCHFDHLKIQIDLAGFVENVGAVGLFDSELTRLVVAASFYGAIFDQHECLVASTGHLDNSLLFSQSQRSVRCSYL